jgi:cytochrome c556
MWLDRHARFVTSLATLIVVGLTPAEMFRSWTDPEHLSSAEAQPAADTRDRVRLTPAERDMILIEMRTMLQSLSKILQGLVAGDLVKVEQAARAAGVPMAADPSLEKKLPAQFLQLGRRTHQRFDALADAIKAGATRDAILGRLSVATAYCVTCHATYRLEETR